MVRKELVKDEKTIKLLKKEDFLEGNIHGNNITSAYSPTSSYEVNEKAGYSLYYPFKHNLNPIPGSGVVDLILTGSFVNSMFFFLICTRIRG